MRSLSTIISRMSSTLEEFARQCRMLPSALSVLTKETATKSLPAKVPSTSGARLAKLHRERYSS